METIKELINTYGGVIVAFIAANAGTVILAVLKTIASRTQISKLETKHEDNLSVQLEEMRMIRDEIKKYAEQAVDANIKAQNKKLESLSVNVQDKVDKAQEDITVSVEDLFK